MINKNGHAFFASGPVKIRVANLNQQAKKLLII